MLSAQSYLSFKSRLDLQTTPLIFGWDLISEISHYLSTNHLKAVEIPSSIRTRPPNSYVDDKFWVIKQHVSRFWQGFIHYIWHLLVLGQRGLAARCGGSAARIRKAIRAWFGLLPTLLEPATTRRSIGQTTSWIIRNPSTITCGTSFRVPERWRCEGARIVSCGGTPFLLSPFFFFFKSYILVWPKPSHVQPCISRHSFPNMTRRMLWNKHIGDIPFSFFPLLAQIVY